MFTYWIMLTSSNKPLCERKVWPFDLIKTLNKCPTPTWAFSPKHTFLMMNLLILSSFAFCTSWQFSKLWSSVSLFFCYLNVSPFFSINYKQQKEAKPLLQNLVGKCPQLYIQLYPFPSIKIMDMLGMVTWIAEVFKKILDHVAVRGLRRSPWKEATFSFLTEFPKDKFHYLYSPCGTLSLWKKLSHEKRQYKIYPMLAETISDSTSAVEGVRLGWIHWGEYILLDSIFHMRIFFSL